MTKVDRIILFLVVVFIVGNWAYALDFTHLKDGTGDDFTSHAPEVLANNLQVPWGIAFLSGGRLLVTERMSTIDDTFIPGRVLLVQPDIELVHVVGIDGPGDVGRVGLRGIALHPSFEDNKYVYLYQTVHEEESSARVARYRFTDGRLQFDRMIIDDIPGGPFHDGGRIAFGKDNKLYITSGDASQSELSQNLTSLGGKILRVNDDGTIPPDNPYDSAVYSYGHRNPQGITWDGSGVLWASEHGPPGGLDEINKIEAGGNYGWPESKGDTVQENTVAPVYQTATSTWAPGSIAYVKDYLLVGGLKGEALYALHIEDGVVVQIHELFKHVYGRIRTVAVGPNGNIYFTTSNRDGRAPLHEGDDRIFRLSYQAFEALLNDDNALMK